MSRYFDSKNTQFLNPEIKQNGNHMIITNVQKPPLKKIVNIDTKFQEEYNSSSYATLTYNLPQPIHDVKSIYVPFMEVPYSFYNFSEQKGNNSFIIVENTTGTEYILKIPDDQYTKSELISYLSGLMTGALNNISITEENDKTKIDVSSGDFTFYWNVSAIKGSSLDADYDKTKLKSRLGWYLGFREPSCTGSSFKSEGMINVNTTNYLFLVVDEFSQNHPNSFVSPLSDSYINKNILARMQVEHHNEFGKIISGAFTKNLISDKRSYGSKMNIYKLKIQLVDEWGVPLDLNKLDFSLVLEIEYE